MKGRRSFLKKMLAVPTAALLAPALNAAAQVQPQVKNSKPPTPVPPFPNYTGDFCLIWNGECWVAQPPEGYILHDHSSPPIDFYTEGQGPARAVYEVR